MCHTPGRRTYHAPTGVRRAAARMAIGWTAALLCLLTVALSACASGTGDGTVTVPTAAITQPAAQPTLGPNIMDQLQRAAPNGAIFDIQQSDAQDSVGPVIGHGV